MKIHIVMRATKTTPEWDTPTDFEPVGAYRTPERAAAIVAVCVEEDRKDIQTVTKWDAWGNRVEDRYEILAVDLED